MKNFTNQWFLVLILSYSSLMKYGRTSTEGRFSEESAARDAEKPPQARERKDKTYAEVKRELNKRRRKNQQEKIIEEL